MLIKNSLRLLVSNLNLVLKTVLYRLVIIVLTYLTLTIVFSDLTKRLIESQAFQVFSSDVLKAWNCFLQGDLHPAIDFKSSFELLMEGIRLHVGEVTGMFIIAIIAVYLIVVLQNISTYTLTYMMNARMTTYENKGFIESLIKNLKRSLPFEALYSLISFFAVLGSVAIAVLFIVYTFQGLFFLSVIVGIWLFVILYSLFITFTALLRPMYVNGVKLKDLFNKQIINKYFCKVWASFIFAMVIFACINITMFICTLGAGTVISATLTQLFFVCLSLVLHFSLTGQKYYIEYESIEVPNKSKEDMENADFLSDIEV